MDRGEAINLMEPLRISSGSGHRDALADLALELTSRSARFRGSIPKHVERSLADLARAMNCYYSNLIEGHDTHPVDIERALKNDYSTNIEKRNLQLEAKAHITVQRWIDERRLKAPATTTESLCGIHRHFCELLPEDLLWVEDVDTHERLWVVPGELRERDVKVGRHVAISPGALPRFMKRFEEVYRGLGKTESIFAAAAAHHRLLWIHPFLDGNGRVARVMSYAMLLNTLDTGSVWSIARGLARNEGEYKRQLMACDQQRRNDLDGRGHLSEDALVCFPIINSIVIQAQQEPKQFIFLDPDFAGGQPNVTCNQRGVDLGSVKLIASQGVQWSIGTKHTVPRITGHPTHESYAPAGLGGLSRSPTGRRHPANENRPMGCWYRYFYRIFPDTRTGADRDEGDHGRLTSGNGRWFSEKMAFILPVHNPNVRRVGRRRSVDCVEYDGYSFA